ncbi:hypothetical protein KM043_007660 [Ampulex compressa]|nr:hypothetical protein KM043_007660 [Ampulex compressa]
MKGSTKEGQQPYEKNDPLLAATALAQEQSVGLEEGHLLMHPPHVLVDVGAVLGAVIAVVLRQEAVRATRAVEPPAHGAHLPTWKHRFNIRQE